MIEQKFIEKGIRKAEMEAYLNDTLERADYSHADIKRTPLNTRIVIYAGRPGVVIGHSGSKINEMTNTLKTKFAVDNPQIEVKSIDNQYLDATVVAKQIASNLERGNKHRQIVNIMLGKIIESGAIGVEIEVSGKISGSRSRSEKFMRGYIKKCGNTSEVLTDKAHATAVLKAGTLGIKVSIMKTMPDVLSLDKKIKDMAHEKTKGSEKDTRKAKAKEEPEEEEESEPDATETESAETEAPKAKKETAKKKKEPKADDVEKEAETPKETKPAKAKKETKKSADAKPEAEPKATKKKETAKKTEKKE